MIAKQLAPSDLPADPRLRAGVEAERQMAFYLHRAFAATPDLHVINGLRLVAPDQPESDGSPGVCQIDHLIIHRWGMLIIESKSVTDTVSVRPDGAGGDEWIRTYRGREQGFPSPIQQAKRQAEFLREYLHARRHELLGRMPFGLRTLSIIVNKTDQRGFRFAPIQLIIAISDSGKINRMKNWKEPRKPLRTFVSKADLVADKVRSEIDHHRANAPLLRSDEHDPYGIWSMKVEEAALIAAFLVDRHTPRSNPQPELPSRVQRAAKPYKPLKHGQATDETSPMSAACRGCSGTDLAAKWGRYGYYWSCHACDANTPMPAVCSLCGAEGSRGKTVRIRKEGRKYFRSCEPCGIEECIWHEP